MSNKEKLWTGIVVFLRHTLAQRKLFAIPEIEMETVVCRACCRCQSSIRPDRQPEGAGGYAPMPAGFGSTIAAAMLFTEAPGRIGGLVAHPIRQNGSLWLDTALSLPTLAGDGIAI